MVTGWVLLFHSTPIGALYRGDGVLFWMRIVVV